jgi:hypothetical protein
MNNGGGQHVSTVEPRLPRMRSGRRMPECLRKLPTASARVAGRHVRLVNERLGHDDRRPSGVRTFGFGEQPIETACVIVPHITSELVLLNVGSIGSWVVADGSTRAATQIRWLEVPTGQRPAPPKTPASHRTTSAAAENARRRAAFESQVLLYSCLRSKAARRCRCRYPVRRRNRRRNAA